MKEGLTKVGFGKIECDIVSGLSREAAPWVLGNRGTRAFISDDQWNKDLKMRGTKAFGEIKIFILGNRGTKRFISGEQRNPIGRASVVVRCGSMGWIMLGWVGQCVQLVHLVVWARRKVQYIMVHVGTGVRPKWPDSTVDSRYLNSW